VASHLIHPARYYRLRWRATVSDGLPAAGDSDRAGGSYRNELVHPALWTEGGHHRSLPVDAVAVHRLAAVCPLLAQLLQSAHGLAEVTQEVPANSIIQIAPILHPAWLQMLQETPELKRKGIQLVPFESERPVSPFVLYFQRNPYLPELLQTQSSDKWTVVKEVARQQVPLGRLVSLKDGR